MTDIIHPMCSKCGKVACSPVIGIDEVPSIDEAPSYCPMRSVPDLVNVAGSEYDKPGVRELARQASIQEFECYERTEEGLRTRIPRIEELIQFSSKCSYKRLGLAFCLGLRGEAQMLTDILENREFEVVSICCKAGATAKQSIGITPDQHIGGPGTWESMCNPIVQAEVLNNAAVDLCVMLGLCIGHDTLFIQYCRVPMTVLAVKDRVTGHNPLAALYLSESPYYRRLSAKKPS